MKLQDDDVALMVTDFKEKLMKRGVIFQILTATPHVENESNESEKRWDMSECSSGPAHMLSTLSAIGSTTIMLKKEREEQESKGDI